MIEVEIALSFCGQCDNVGSYGRK